MPKTWAAAMMRAIEGTGSPPHAIPKRTMAAEMAASRIDSTLFRSAEQYRPPSECQCNDESSRMVVRNYANSASKYNPMPGPRSRNPSPRFMAEQNRDRTSETKSVDTRGCSRGRHVGEPGGKEPCRRGRRRNGRRWPAASRHRWFRRFCRASGGVSGRAWPCAAPRRSRHARRTAGWPTPPRGGPGRRRAGRCRPRRSAATWAGLVHLLGRPLVPVLRPVSPPVRPALRPALRARWNRRILPEIPRELGGSIPPGSILPSLHFSRTLVFPHSGLSNSRSSGSKR